MLTLTQKVKAIARGLGFDPVGVTDAGPFRETEEAIVQRVNDGLMDGLPWFSESRSRRGCNPKQMLPQARSIISVGLDYSTEPLPEPHDRLQRGRVSRYAWGRDYHRVFEGRLKKLIRRLEPLGGGKAKFYVDYGPIPDRAVAARAGLGWYGKNSNLLTTKRGSWIFLAEVLTDLELTPDRPIKKSCGKCNTCMPACPTGAIVAPYVIDNRRCISFHTIENRGPIPVELRSLFGDWIFGCDVCQDVCPVNGQRETSGDSEFAATSLEDARPSLVEILKLTEEEFQERFQGRALMRATRAGLQRNACVALGNSRDPIAVGPLTEALKNNVPLVRGHAAWALGRIGGDGARRALEEACELEADDGVLKELSLALAGV